jgi:thiamine biosynthesis lipoprotein
MRKPYNVPAPPRPQADLPRRTSRLGRQGSKFSDYKNIHSLSFFTLYVLLFTVILSCSPKKESTYRKTMILMDTLVTINVVADSADRADKGMDKAFAVIGKLDGMLSFFSESSELSLVNKNAGISPVTVSPETLEVIDKALSTSEKTGGAFDATIGPESSLWDFYAKKKPDDKTIRERLGLVNYRHVVIDRDKSTVYLEKKGMRIDLGAIAKGYAADKAVEELKKQGIISGLVSVAGDIKAFGLKPDGKPWRVGVRNPRQKGADDEIMATIELKDMAISTSGDYERYFFLDDKRYHHILDPKTGYPAHGCQSVTVIAQNGVDTDSFSTGIFVLGPEKGMQLLKEMGFLGMIIDRDGKIQSTPGFRENVGVKGNH